MGGVIWSCEGGWAKSVGALVRSILYNDETFLMESTSKADHKVVHYILIPKRAFTPKGKSTSPSSSEARRAC